MGKIEKSIEDRVTELLEFNGYDMGEQSIPILTNPDFYDSLIGISEDMCAVYDYDLMVKELAEREGISDFDAEDFIDYNTIRAIPYFNVENKPIIVHMLVRENEAGE